jgi:hypothetical protein
MKKILTILLLTSSLLISAQENYLEKLQFIIGDWNGTGVGFGNSTSTITASYKFIMNKKYIEAKHESIFKLTDKNKKGDHHIDNGFISFDTSRKKIVYRQFNNEGYVNQYILNEELSTSTSLIFETEIIENFVSGGKARLTINKISETEIETIFDVSFPNKGYSCFGTNKLIKN